jgi:hypothetical protein
MQLNYGTADSNHPITNTVTGERGKRFALSIAWDYNANLYYDLGSSVTANIDHVIIARADLLKALGATNIQLDSSANGSVWGNRAGTSSALQTRTYDGVRGEDLIFTQTYNNDTGTLAGSSHRYWALYFGAVTALKSTFSKVYFGTFFDFGREPSYPAIQNRRIQRPGNRDAVYQFTLKWQGITNTKRNELFDKILQYRDVNPVFLYDTDDLILNGIKLLHCRILDASITPITAQYNDVEILFEELI